MCGLEPRSRSPGSESQYTNLLVVFALENPNSKESQSLRQRGKGTNETSLTLYLVVIYQQTRVEHVSMSAAYSLLVHVFFFWGLIEADYNVVALLRTVDAVKAAVGNNLIHTSPSRTVNDGINVEPEQPFFYL